MFVDTATLTNPEDFTRFLTVICGKTTDAFLKDERVHTNDKIRIVVNSFAERMESLKNDYETKIDNLEKHINELLTEANLKTDTLGVYQNQLLFNLKSGLQGALANVDQDIRALSNEIRTCNICSKNFGTLGDLQNHILYEHSLHSSFPCQVCREPFSSFSELNVHLLKHVTHPSVDPNDLNIDPDPVNENSYTEPVCHDPQHCNICDEIFTTFDDLSNHTKKVHACYPVSCQSCGKGLQSINDLEKHIKDVHTWAATPTPSKDATESFISESSVTAENNSCSFIPQYDGNDTLSSHDDEDSTNIIVTEAEVYDQNRVEATFTFGEPNKQPATNRNVANFVLNRAKQINSLGEDTALDDFEVTINDSDKNVNIHCSTGFYDKVAKPVLCGLSQGSNISVNNISIECNRIDYNRDRTLCEYNRVLHLQLGGSGKTNIGKITIHLHHTKRHIQMQGSTIMSDGNRSPVWFLNTFIKEKFTNLAKFRKFDIACVNKNINAIISKQKKASSVVSSCSNCMRHFTQNTKPTKCTNCEKFFHKTSCLPSHFASCKQAQQAPSSQQSCASGSFLSSNSLQSTPASSIHARLSTEDSISVSPVDMSVSGQVSSISILTTSMDTDTVTTTAVQEVLLHPSVSYSNITPVVDTSRSDSGISNALSILTDNPVTTTSSLSALNSSIRTGTAAINSALNPEASSFTQAASNQSKRKTKPKNTISPENAKIQYLNLELNSAKTRIAQLDTIISDHEATIKIQEDKIKILEMQQHSTANENNKLNSAGIAAPSSQSGPPSECPYQAAGWCLSNAHPCPCRKSPVCHPPTHCCTLINSHTCHRLSTASDHPGQCSAKISSGTAPPAVLAQGVVDQSQVQAMIDISKAIIDIRNDIADIANNRVVVGENATAEETIVAQNNPESLIVETNSVGEHENMETSHDESVVTIDEFTNDLESEKQIALNCNSPTSQQQMLMHQ